LPLVLQPALIADLQHRTWHHVVGPVSEAQYRADKDRCAAMADHAPPRDGAPPEVKYWMAYFDCLRASGYEPILDQPPN
jgi:hypothetical protein